MEQQLPYQQDIAAVNEAAANIIAFREEQQRQVFQPDFIATETVRLARAFDAAQDRTRIVFSDHRSARLAEARNIRTEVDAQRDPTLRLADEMELNRLTGGKDEAETILGWASKNHQAGEDDRAHLLLSAAEAKGIPVTSMQRAQALRKSITDARDLSNPRLKEARRIEESVSVEAELVERSILSARASTGDTSASVRLKMLDHQLARESA